MHREFLRLVTPVAVLALAAVTSVVAVSGPVRIVAVVIGLAAAVVTFADSVRVYRCPGPAPVIPIGGSLFGANVTLIGLVPVWVSVAGCIGTIAVLSYEARYAFAAPSAGAQ